MGNSNVMAFTAQEVFVIEQGIFSNCIWIGWVGMNLALLLSTADKYQLSVVIEF